jgi:hypothetical protein
METRPIEVGCNIRELCSRLQNSTVRMHRLQGLLGRAADLARRSPVLSVLDFGRPIFGRPIYVRSSRTIAGHVNEKYFCR